MEEQKNTPENNELSNGEGSDIAQNEVQSSTSEIDELTTLHERVIASLSYVGFLAVVPFYLKKESKFCRFHGKQGLIIAIIFFFASPLMVLDIIQDAVLLAKIAIFAFMGLAALSGKWKKAPFVYNYACKLESSLSLDDKSQQDKSEKEVSAENQN